MRCRVVAIEVVEDGRERFSPAQDVARLAAVAVHVDGEDGVVGEECLLSGRVPPIGTVRVCVEEFADGETIGGFGRSNFGVHSHRWKLLRVGFG